MRGKRDCMICDELLLFNLNKITEEVSKRNVDWWFGVVAMEGTGKSTMALQIAQSIDKNFHTGKIVFDKFQFINAVDKAEKYSAIVVDEGAELFFYLNSMSRESKELTQLATTMRYKNLFVIICIANFKMLQWYFKSHRLKTLLGIETIGTGCWYSRKRIRMIKEDALKRTIYPSPNFRFKFPKLDDKLWKEYEKKKELHFARKRHETKTVLKMRQKYEKKIEGSLTLAQVSEIWMRPIGTIRQWMFKGVFPKKYCFKDIAGKMRIKREALPIVERKLLRANNK